MSKLLNDTKINLALGLRLAFFRKCDVSQFIINADQLVLLVCLDLLLNIVFGYVSVLPNPEFVSYGLPTYSLDQLVSLLLAFILAKLWKRPELFLILSIMILSLSPIYIGLTYLGQYLQLDLVNAESHYQWWGYLFTFYFLTNLANLFYQASGRLKAFASIALLSFLVSSVLQHVYFSDYQDFWYLAEEHNTQGNDYWAEYSKMDGETLMYSQPEILATALNTLKPQRQDVSDLFFVGFASYATEDVFLKEVTFIKNMFDTRFDTKGYSINLVNHLSTRETVPLANASNLAITLKRIGHMMNNEEDVLVMYLTSHGSKNHELSVSFWPLPMNPITPDKLQVMLDEAGIKWRVIIISACYSGGFIEALENDNTLVATSSAADKTSFGCGSESEFTYFGEALFKDRLPNETSFISALQQVKVDIAEREKRENIKASLPQLSIGSSVKIKLEQLSEEINIYQCESAIKNESC